MFFDAFVLVDVQMGISRAISISEEKTISNSDAIPGERRDKGAEFGISNGDFNFIFKMLNNLPHRTEARLIRENPAIDLAP